MVQVQEHIYPALRLQTRGQTAPVDSLLSETEELVSVADSGH